MQKEQKTKKQRSFKNMIFTSWQFWLVFGIFFLTPLGQSTLSKALTSGLFGIVGYSASNIFLTLIVFGVYYGGKKVLKKK